MDGFCVCVVYLGVKCVHNVKRLVRRRVTQKLVIMVIDAWRAGFYFDNITCKMPFLCALQNSGQAFAFEAHVQTPTVTMPHIKVCELFELFSLFISLIAAPIKDASFYRWNGIEIGGRNMGLYSI